MQRQVFLSCETSWKVLLAGHEPRHYTLHMVIIRFSNVEMRRRALGYLLGRFPGKSWATGEVMAPESALAHLAAEKIIFTVEGPATYDRLTGFGANEVGSIIDQQATAPA